MLANWRLLILKIKLTLSLSKCKLDKIINLTVFHGHYFDISFLEFQKQLILFSNFDKDYKRGADDGNNSLIRNRGESKHSE